MSGSINTNLAALSAVRTLEATQSQLQATEKQVNTGYQVADAIDNGAVFAIAQSIRTTQSGLGAVNTQINFALGFVSVANNALTTVSNYLTDLKAQLTGIANPLNSSATLVEYQNKYLSDLANINNALDNADYQGNNLLSNVTNFGVIQNYLGGAYTITAQGTTIASAVTYLSTSLDATGAGSWLQATGSFDSAIADIGSALSTVGSIYNYLNNAITFNNGIADGLTQGLGALIDADLSVESAQLTSLQIKQQLATQALSIANQGPQVLLTLFR
jgi:flagellin